MFEQLGKLCIANMSYFTAVTMQHTEETEPVASLDERGSHRIGLLELL